ERLAGTAERDQAAVTAERLGARFQRHGAGDVIYDHIHPLSAGQIEQGFNDIAVAWIDDRIGAGLTAGVEFVRGTYLKGWQRHETKHPRPAMASRTFQG